MQLDRIKRAFRVVREFLLSPLPEMVAGFDSKILESDSDARRFGYFTILLVFGGFGLWAALAPLESAARGAGTVKVEGDSKPVQHLDGGIVSKILVENGSYVDEGDSLIMLDATELLAEKRIIESRFWAMRANVDRLISERDDHVEVGFSFSLSETNDGNVEIAMRNEQTLFEARRATRFGEIAVLEKRIAQFQQKVSGGQEVLVSKRAIVDSLELELRELRQLLADGYVDKQRIRLLERTLADTLAQIADQEAVVASAIVAIQEAELEITQLNQRFVTDVINELTEAQEQLFDIEQRFTAISHRVRQSNIRSPARGYVMALEPNTAGEVIAPGQQLMEIVPDIEKLVIDLRLSPMDIDRVQIGQEAEVRFAVFKDSYTITGELVKISADSLSDDATGEQYYQAKVDLYDNDLRLLGDYKLVPGMPADVLVKTGKRTFMGYLTSPLKRMFDNSLIED